jgi:hypothetical protein
MKIMTIPFVLLLLTQSAWAKNPYAELSPTPSNFVSSEECGKIKVKYAKKFDEVTLGKIFSEGNATLSEEELLGQVRTKNGSDFFYLDKVNILKLARCGRYIDDVIYDFLSIKLQQEQTNAAGESAAQTPYISPMPIQSYLLKKIKIQAISKIDYSQITNDPFPLKNFPVSVGEGQKISVKEKLYAQYTIDQIREMSQILGDALSIMTDVEKAETVIYFRKDSHREKLVIEHTPSDIYRLALRRFMMEKKQLIAKYAASNLPFSNLDILASANEMGVVSSAEIGLLTGDEKFYKKETPPYKKILSFVGKIGLTAAQIVPATAPYAIVGVIIYNSYNELNKAKESIELENFYFN